MATFAVRSLFFIPVYNQIKEFPGVLQDLQNTALPCDTILLVNNGSSDGSEDLVPDSGYPYIDLAENRGSGYSYKLSLLWALERQYEVFGTMASNGKMLAQDMRSVLHPILKGEADYVTGSRFLPGAESPNLPTFRRISIPLVNSFVKFLTGVQLTDATCGYRAFKLDLIRRAQFDWQAEWLHTYGLEYYLYAKVILDGEIRWKEVPVTMRYPPKGQRYSKIRPFVDWWAMVKPWIIARFDGKGFAQEMNHP
ncbi:glycosyltransferase family 2 protein [Acidobacteria bacterium AH-259-L09]|nr:glycosyltransferase family 2 protein [Acidobacteria bacterium AH-259-L09]